MTAQFKVAASTPRSNVRRPLEPGERFCSRLAVLETDHRLFQLLSFGEQWEVTDELHRRSPRPNRATLRGDVRCAAGS